MKRPARNLLAAVVCGVFALNAHHARQSPAFAADAYTCEVLHVYNSADDGALKKSNFLDEELRGSRFTVSKLDGQILGKVLPTLMADNVEVVWRGDKSNSFRATAAFGDTGAGRKFQYLEVQEFKAGNQKPFVAMASATGIVTGLCE